MDKNKTRTPLLYGGSEERHKIAQTRVYEDCTRVAKDFLSIMKPQFSDDDKEKKEPE